MEAYVSQEHTPGITFHFEENGKPTGSLTLGVPSGKTEEETEKNGLLFELDLPGNGDYYGDQYLEHGWRMTHKEGRQLRDYLDRVYPAPNFLGVQIPNIEGLPTEDVDALTTVFDRLSLFCKAISDARYHRTIGAIGQALKFEAQADRLYGDLPPELRW